MKAILLSAGLGTRLRPITDTTPKCLVEIGGRTMLDIWLDSFAAAGIDDVLVNVHHFAADVERHVAARTGPPRVVTAFEPVLLGSAGTLVANRQFVEGDPCFLACNGDNLTDFDLTELVEFHASHGGDASLTVFHAERPSECGIVEVEDSGLVVSFTEKPSRPAGDLANAGIYAFSPRLLPEIPARRPSDLGYDLLPLLVGRARALPIEGYFRDIGTPAALDAARDEWPVAVRR